jgi:hypothetical protein
MRKYFICSVGTDVKNNIHSHQEIVEHENIQGAIKSHASRFNYSTIIRMTVLRRVEQSHINDEAEQELEPAQLTIANVVLADSATYGEVRLTMLESTETHQFTNEIQSNG